MIEEYLCVASNEKHIVVNPLAQECGKYACEECLDKVQSKDFYCNSCNKRHTKLGNEVPSKVIQIINENRIKFNKLLDVKEKYEELKGSDLS
jgi:hypothetical protein